MFKDLECKDCGSSSFVRVDDDTLMCEYCKGLMKKKTSNDEIVKTAHLEDKEESKQKDKKNFALVKLLLCIFLGQFGVHRFVEGKIISGILFAVTHGLFGIGYLCDIFRLAKELADDHKEGENDE